jgi:hypothetical protein
MTLKEALAVTSKGTLGVRGLAVPSRRDSDMIDGGQKMVRVAGNGTKYTYEFGYEV